MTKISRHQPSPSCAGQSQKRQVRWIWTCQSPRLRVHEPQALFNQKLQPRRREPVSLEIQTPNNVAVFGHHLPAGHHLDMPLRHPVHDDLCRRSSWLDARGNNHIGIQHYQPHSAFRACRSARDRLISRSISSSLMPPAASASRHPSRRLARAIARRISLSSLTTSPKTGTKKKAGPSLLTRSVVSPAGTSAKAFCPRVLNSRSET